MSSLENRIFADLRIDRHFGPEASATPWTFVRWMIDPAFRCGDRMIPIHLDDLVKSAEAKRWSMTYADMKDT